MPKNPRFPPTLPTPASRSLRLRTVEILTFPGGQLLDVAGPLQVFATANELVAARGDAPLYAVRVVSAGAPNVVTSAGLGLAVAPLPRVSAKLDTLLVAGGPGVHAAANNPRVLDWLRRRAKRARRVASVCTGAFLLGAVGLLNERRAATHWRHCAELARRHPAIRVESDPIYVRDGSVWTSAGVTAAIDLALALVEEDAGRGALARGGAASGDVSQASRRPGAVQHGSVAARRRRSFRRSACLDERSAERRPVAAGDGPQGRHERAQLQPALCADRPA